MNKGKITIEDLIEDSPINLGDSINNIDRSSIGRIHVKYVFPNFSRNGKEFERLENGTEREIFFEEKYNYLLEGKSGDILLKEADLWCEVKDKKIVSITVNNCLNKLGIISEEQIEKVFGVADKVDKDLFTNNYLYFEHGFGICWPLPENEDIPRSITIGFFDERQASHQKNLITVTDLLNQFLKLMQYPKSSLNINKASLQSDPVVFLRLNNFLSLLTAFGLTPKKNRTTEENRASTTVMQMQESDSGKPKKSGTYSEQSYIDKFVTDPLSYFEKGHFIDHFTEQDYAYNIETLRAFFMEKGKASKIARRRANFIGLIDLKSVYSWFLNYRLKANQPLSVFSSILEGGGTSLQYATHILGNINDSFRKELEPVEKLLCELIDPFQRSFTPRDLEVNYGYCHTDIDYIWSCMAWEGEYPQGMVEKNSDFAIEQWQDKNLTTD